MLPYNKAVMTLKELKNCTIIYVFLLSVHHNNIITQVFIDKTLYIVTVCHWFYLVSSECIKLCNSVAQRAIPIHYPHLDNRQKWKANKKIDDQTKHFPACAYQYVTSDSGRHSFAPRANPPPTPKVPKAPSRTKKKKCYVSAWLPWACTGIKKTYLLIMKKFWQT